MERISRRDLDANLAARLEEDPTLRERLIADPRAVVEEITGLPIPGMVTITVHQESLTDVHLVIEALTADLSEEDLALIEGGVGSPPYDPPTLPCTCHTGCSGWDPDPPWRPL